MGSTARIPSIATGIPRGRVASIKSPGPGRPGPTEPSRDRVPSGNVGRSACESRRAHRLLGPAAFEFAVLAAHGFHYAVDDSLGGLSCARRLEEFRIVL